MQGGLAMGKKGGSGMNQQIDMESFQQIVREAGQMLLKARVSEQGVFNKPGDANFVTVFDMQIQRFLIEKLRELLPEAGFFGEEDTEGNQHDSLETGYTFIIDPIDGTTNFMFGYHHSCVSVGLAFRGKIIAGCVFNPYLDAMYTAQLGEGSYCNGTRLRLDDRRVSEGLIAFGCARYNESDVELLFDVVKALFYRCLGIRECGSAALDLCAVASGSNVAYLEMKLQPYDYAAGSLILEEAGGCIVQPDGSPITFDRPCPVVSGTKAAVAEILALIKEKKNP